MEKPKVKTVPKVAGTSRRHYWLVAGTVILHDSESNARITQALNTVNKTEKHFFPARELGKAQQSMQMQFFRENFPEGPPATLQVMDVHIAGVSYLGHMTEDEFQAPPVEPRNPKATN